MEKIEMNYKKSKNVKGIFILRNKSICFFIHKVVQFFKLFLPNL